MTWKYDHDAYMPNIWHLVAGEDEENLATVWKVSGDGWRWGVALRSGIGLGGWVGGFAEAQAEAEEALVLAGRL